MLNKQQLIEAYPDQVAARDDQAIADALSIGRMKIIPRPIGIGTIVGVMYPNGGLFLKQLEDMAAVTPETADSLNVKYTMEVIRAGNFDVGDPTYRLYLQAFAQGYTDFADGIAALLALAVMPDPVTVGEVSDVLNKEL